MNLDPGVVTLDQERKEVFHSIVARLLWVMKRARPDLEITIVFLCTRVTKSDKDYWKELKRVLTFINCRIDNREIIGVDRSTKKSFDRCCIYGDP